MSESRCSETLVDRLRSLIRARACAGSDLGRGHQEIRALRVDTHPTVQASRDGGEAAALEEKTKHAASGHGRDRGGMPRVAKHPQIRIPALSARAASGMRVATGRTPCMKGGSS
jgi:hypothetical protein